MKLRKLLFAFFAFFSCAMFAQKAQGPELISEGVLIGTTIPLRDMPTVQEMELEGFENIKEFKQQYDPTDYDAVLNENALPADGQDPVIQDTQGTRAVLNLLQNFEGSRIQESGGATPPDPTGAVGPNHYVHAVNSVVKIFDKAGGLLTGPTFLGTFLGSGNNDGDPIVLYDHLADRFFVSQFRPSTNGLIIGVSTSPDPTGSYNVYEYDLDSFPDYPHYTVWPDAYYVTANKNSGFFNYAFDRQAMIDGDATAGIIGYALPGLVRNPLTVLSPEPAHLLGTDFDPDAPAYIIYLQDDLWGGVTFDHLKVWEVDIDFDNPGNSTVSQPLEIPTAPFDSFFRSFPIGDFDQAGTTQRIQGASGVISFAANYRKFDTHNSWIITFNADVGSVRSGIRWIELRNDDTNDWSIFQEGTYAPDDGLNRFMSSAAIDIDGNIGMAYSTSSANDRPGIRYTGRFNGDELGEMTFPESLIFQGTGSNTGNNRFGDYAHTTMDTDGLTFWNTSQYFIGNSQWRTRISSFVLNGGLSDDVGAFNFVEPVSGDLGDDETVTVSLFNFGNMPQSNFNVELSLDGTVVATEMFTGTIAPLSQATFTFNTTLDLSTPEESYDIEARTLLASDANTPNDSFEVTIENTILSVNDQEFNSGDFTIVPKGSKLYEVNFATSKDFGDISYRVYNTIGQEVSNGILTNKGTEHNTTLDFSSQPIGVFFVNLTNGEFNATKRVVVYK